MKDVDYVTEAEMVQASGGNVVESFFLAVRVVVNFVCNCQQSAGRYMGMNY